MLNVCFAYAKYFFLGICPAKTYIKCILLNSWLRERTWQAWGTGDVGRFFVLWFRLPSTAARRSTTLVFQPDVFSFAFECGISGCFHWPSIGSLSDFLSLCSSVLPIFFLHRTGYFELRTRGANRFRIRIQTGRLTRQTRCVHMHPSIHPYQPSNIPWLSLGSLHVCLLWFSGKSRLTC